MAIAIGKAASTFEALLCARHFRWNTSFNVRIIGKGCSPVLAYKRELAFSCMLFLILAQLRSGRKEHACHLVAKVWKCHP